jgi:hypothetical protein
MAQVLVNPRDSSDWSRKDLRMPGHAWTEEQGTFEVSAPTPGPWRIDALGSRRIAGSPPGSQVRHEPWTAWIPEVVSASSDLTLVLQPPVDLDGRVVDEQGDAIPIFTVQTASYLHAEDRVQTQSTQSFESSDGKFRLTGIARGRTRVAATADGYVLLGRGEFVEAPLLEGSVTIRMVRAATVSGRVVDPSGRPVSGASVLAYPKGTRTAFRELFADLNPECTTNTDDEGGFRLPGLSPEVTSIVCSAEGHVENEPLDFDLRPGQSLGDLVLHLRVGGRLTIEIPPDPEGRAWAGKVWIYSMDESLSREAKPGAKGIWSIDHLLPGTYEANAESTDSRPRPGMTASVFVRDRETKHVVLGSPPEHPVRISGRVLRNGEPVGAGRVTAFVPRWLWASADRSVDVDASGHFALTLDEPGPVTLVWWPPRPSGLGCETHVLVRPGSEQVVDLVGQSRTVTRGCARDVCLF